MFIKTSFIMLFYFDQWFHKFWKENQIKSCNFLLMLFGCSGGVELLLVVVVIALLLFVVVVVVVRCCCILDLGESCVLSLVNFVLWFEFSLWIKDYRIEMLVDVANIIEVIFIN